MKTLVERLNERTDEPICVEAAAEIERLRKVIMSLAHTIAAARRVLKES